MSPSDQKPTPVERPAGDSPRVPFPPASGGPEASFLNLVDLMARLRTPGSGCPWDLEQTFETIAPYTIEEAYEVADAIERRNMDDLKGELGDLLFQSVFHARMAEEAGAFTIDDVLKGLIAKMVERHPHVFGQAQVDTAEQQTEAWEAMKARERAARAAGGPPSALDGVALALPALLRAEKLTKRAARVGFDWPSPAEVLAKLDEEVGELHEALASDDSKAHIEEELGDILFVCANLCRKLEVDPEAALRGANAKFQRRFTAMEKLAGERGQSFAELDLDAQERLWQAVKDAERGLNAPAHPGMPR
jgi:nucleoside triphosphate diphosphatase